MRKGARYHARTLARFWASVDRRMDAECWPWTGAKNHGGYGHLKVWVGAEHSERIATRVMWTLTHGPIPDGLFVLHRCDNPPCVNPAHLFLGTNDDNMRDAFVKHRIRTPQHRELPWPLNLIREANAARAAAKVTSPPT